MDQAPPDRVPTDQAQPPGRQLSAAEQRRLSALEDFPPGHPSSPYLGNGTRRPPRPNLRSLELPLPDEQGDISGRRGETAQGLTKVKDGSPDNRVGRPHNFPNSDAPRGPEAEARNYWTEVPRFISMWVAHEHVRPKDKQPAAAVDRSGDPPGVWRSDGNIPLDADTHARTRKAIDNVQRVEGPMTGDVKEVERDNLQGGWLEGLDFRLKGEERLKEKVAEALRDNPDATPDDVVRAIPDTIRYTFCTDQMNYTAGYWDIKERLEARGYEMYMSKNSWVDQEYKGINTRWMTPEGQRFELQFHTRESYHAKQEITHEAYERARNPLTSKNELDELRSFQREVSSWIAVPAGATEIPSFRRGGF